MANRKDPAWKYGVEVEFGERKAYKYIRCIFCEKIIKGGVFRLKEHLAGTHGNVAPCERVNPEVRDEIKGYLTKTRDAKKQAQLAREERLDSSINFNSPPSTGGSTSAPVSQRGIRGPMDRFFTNVNEDDVQIERERPSTGSEKEARYHTCLDISRFFFENGIAFNVAQSPSFINMCRSIGNYGRGLKPPTPHEIRTNFLNDEVANTVAIVDDIKKTWVETGVSIMSDGWKDVRGRQLVNFLVNNPHGTVFLKSIDVSDVVKDAKFLFKLLDDVVEDVGEDLVVQVVTDNASNYKKAGEMLMEKRKRLWWTPCAAHCIDLMLEKIGELPQHKNALLKAKKVSNFIYNHGWVLALMRSHTKKDLVRPAPTRFATAYLTLQSMYSLKTPLQQMFISEEWRESSWAKKPEGKAIKRIILTDESFWYCMSYALKTTKPIVNVLRMVDSEKVPAMGFIYGAIDQAKEEIAKTFGNDLGAYKEIWDIIDNKWEFQLHRHLHAAAYFLNPQIHYSENSSKHPEIERGVIMCVEKLFTNEMDKVKAHCQMDDYRQKRGMFGYTLAKNTVNKRSPADWWLAFGADTPELKSFAVRILSLTCSSSACERNWSAFNMVHTKKRNRLETKRLNDLVYIMYNRRLQHRYLKKRALKDDEDPLVISDDVPSDDEWVNNEFFGANMCEPSGSRKLVSYTRKRIRDKGKNIQEVAEEPELEENETSDEDDEDETLPPDSTMPPYFDPNFRLLDSNDSLFHSPSGH